MSILTITGTNIRKNVTKIRLRSPTFEIGHQHRIFASCDVGDRLGCHQHLQKCHQHSIFITNIQKLSSTSIDHQYAFSRKGWACPLSSTFIMKVSCLKNILVRTFCSEPFGPVHFTYIVFAKQFYGPKNH